ncbi:Os03g0757000, partial [Oryza sativa Japonica Group]
LQPPQKAIVASQLHKVEEEEKGDRQIWLRVTSSCCRCHARATSSRSWSSPTASPTRASRSPSSTRRWTTRWWWPRCRRAAPRSSGSGGSTSPPSPTASPATRTARTSTSSSTPTRAKLIEDGVLNEKGWPERQETLQLAPGMPPLHTSLLSWNNSGAAEGQHIIFDLVCRNNKFNDDLAEMTVCNSFHEAEPAVFKLFPDLLPIGPLVADRELRRPVGHFLPEDAGCLDWLDAQPDGSVVYVAFGSLAIFDARQFQELAVGLELTGRPFLWVVRPDFTPGLSTAWLDAFRRRVAGRGVIVEWCSQQRVLAHAAVACFVSHCGWNSTLEGVRNGVPFLCWPYFCDQFLDRSYITAVWRTGLAVAAGEEDGVVTRDEVRSKVEQVVGDGEIRERARLLRDTARACVSEGGSSHKNFRKFIDLLSE